MKRKSLLRITAVWALVLSGLTAGAAAPGSWEPLKNEPTNLKSVVKDTDLEVKAQPGAVVVVTNKPVQVKVFTILGQLVSSETIGTGVTRLQVNAHGVYIIKIGELTCKVAL